MSVRAYLLAAKAHLHTLFGLSGATAVRKCDVMFSGMPPPSCGELFLALHYGECRGTGEDTGVLEDIAFQVTATRRLPYAPQDAGGTEIWLKATEGLDAICRKVIFGDASTRGLLANYPVMNVANATYITASYSPFHRPCMEFSIGPPILQGARWFNGGHEAESADAGASQTITFRGIQREQGLPPTYEVS